MKRALAPVLLMAALMALLALFANRAPPVCRAGSVEALFTDCGKR